MCDCGCDSGCANGCGQPTKIITKEGIQGPAGPAGATGATGANGADGSDGLGYDNMTSTSNINLGLTIPFSDSNSISTDKAVNTGTRLRYTKTSDLTQWIEGVVTSYNVVTGLTGIDFDLKSPTAAGAHTDWSVSVIGEPGSGSGFEDIVNVGSGAEVYKGINGTDAELRSLIGSGALSGGITQGTNEIDFNPLTDTEKVEVYPGGTAISPSFSYSAGSGESLVSPGSIGTSVVKYFDWNDFIFLTFQVQINGFYLTGPFDWSKDPFTFQINGLPVLPASGSDPETFMGGMSASPVENPTSDPDYVMRCTKPVQFVYNSGSIGVKSGGAFYPRVPTRNEAVNLFFYGQILIRKN